MAEKISGGAKPMRISDVAKPGKSAPSASSKPIIVTNRPVLKDPMMVDDSATNAGTATKDLPLNHLKISPLSDTSSDTEAVKSEPAEAASPKLVSETSPVETTTEPPAEAEAADHPADEPSTADDETAPPKTESAIAKADADQAAAELRTKELNDLAVSRKYFLPINQVEKRKAKQYAWAGILLILLLAVAWADVAADAGIISIPGVKAPTHFFSN